MTIVIILLILILIALVFGGEAVAGIFQFILKLGFWLIIALLVLLFIGYQIS
jgi:hypothetical protein